MNQLTPPRSPGYDYDALSNSIDVWRRLGVQEKWLGEGYPTCAPIHKNAVTSRQWDSYTEVSEDELEKSTANIVGECLAKLDAVERCIIMFAECGVESSWVHDMEQDRAQARYEAALLRLALLCRGDGMLV